MTGKAFVDYIRLKTRTNSGTFTDTEILALANVRLDTIAHEVLDVDEDIFVTPMKTNLIAGNREYPFPQSLLSRIKYVEAKFDGTNWAKLTEMDLHQYTRTTDETYILSRFANEEGKAFYDIDRKSLWIYSGAIANVELGLKLWCNVYPAYLDASRIANNVTDMSVDPTDTTFGFPRELHEIWARGVIIDWKESREKPIPLTQSELAYRVDLQNAIFKMKHGNLDRSVIAQIPPASDRGNNGANY